MFWLFLVLVLPRLVKGIYFMFWLICVVFNTSYAVRLLQYFNPVPRLICEYSSFPLELYVVS